MDDAANMGDVIVLTQEELELARLEDDLRTANNQLEATDAETQELRQTVDDLQQATVTLQNQLETALAARDAEIVSLKAEQEALLIDLERLSIAAEVAAAHAATAQTAAETVVASAQTGIASVRTDAANSEDAARSNGVIQGALTDALGGLGGFRRVDDLGFRSDSRMGARLAVAGSGLAVDSTGDEPILFDTALSFDSSLIYLTIADPASRNPRLILTVQYVSDVRPLYAQTAFISIEGNDPIDPVDPVIFTGSPDRETDGVRIREAFSRDVDRSLLNRISRMLSSSSFAGTFVGTVGRESHRPTLAERAALSRVLFAYIDLGGYQ
jgi:hypothetical protein